MATYKSAQQQLARESENALKRFFEDDHKWSVIISNQQDDFGTDGEVLVFDSDSGKHNQRKLDFQLKSTTDGANERDIEIRHLDMWKESILPFFLFFWNRAEKELYFLNVHEYYGTLSRSDPAKLKQNTVLVKFTEKLNHYSFNHIKRTVDNLYQIVGQAILEHSNKNAEIKDFLGRGPITAMGYSFAGHDISKKILQGAALMGANFERTILSNSDLRGVIAMGANFNGANLNGADLRGASVMGAYFENADMRETKLEGATFMGAFLASADFRRASFNDVSLWSISKAYDFEKAKYDDGILEKILPFTKLIKIPSVNVVSEDDPVTSV